MAKRRGYICCNWHNEILHVSNIYCTRTVCVRSLTPATPSRGGGLFSCPLVVQQLIQLSYSHRVINYGNVDTYIWCTLAGHVGAAHWWCVCVWAFFFSSFDILLLLCSLIAMWARSAILSLSLICDLQWNTRQEFSSILDCCSWCRKAFPDTHTVQTAIQVPQHHQQQQQWQQQIQFI